jgi:hypothetical protein
MILPGSNFFHWQDTGASLQVVTTHSTLKFPHSEQGTVLTSYLLVILELRLWAMYGNNMKFLFIFVGSILLIHLFMRLAKATTF